MMTILMMLLAAVLQTAPGPLTTVSRDQMSGIDEPRQVVARSAEEWAALWRQHAGDQPPPTIDFGTRTVLAVFLGTRMSAGYAVEIVGTRVEGADLVVQWREHKPERGMVSAQIITSPSHIVSVPKVTGMVRFEQDGQ